MLEVDFRGEQAAGPVRELQGQGAPSFRTRCVQWICVAFSLGLPGA